MENNIQGGYFTETPNTDTPDTQLTHAEPCVPRYTPYPQYRTVPAPVRQPTARSNPRKNKKRRALAAVLMLAVIVSAAFGLGGAY